MEDSVKYLLSFLILGAFFFLSYVVIGGHIDATDPQKLLLIGSAYGSLTTIAVQVVTYHYGSTKASGDKDKTISKMVDSVPVLPSTQTTTTTKIVDTPATKPTTESQ